MFWSMNSIQYCNAFILLSSVNTNTSVSTTNSHFDNTSAVPWFPDNIAVINGVRCLLSWAVTSASRVHRSKTIAVLLAAHASCNGVLPAKLHVFKSVKCSNICHVMWTDGPAHAMFNIEFPKMSICFMSASCSKRMSTATSFPWLTANAKAPWPLSATRLI